MGVVLFWIYDRSPDQKRTRLLVEKSAAMVTRLIKVAGFPLLRPARKMVAEKGPDRLWIAMDNPVTVFWRLCYAI